MAKRDVGDRCSQSIKRPRPDLKRPERRYAALNTELGHSVILSSTPLPETPFWRTSCTAHRKVLTPHRFTLSPRPHDDYVVGMVNPFKQKRSSKPALAIAVGGVVAGALDLTQAMILFGKNVPLAIAGGLLGPRAFQGGAGFYILGVLLHFFIACSAAAIYFAVSRKLKFLTEYPVTCGLFFGAAVEVVMTLIVLRLSGLGNAMGTGIHLPRPRFGILGPHGSLLGNLTLSVCGSSRGNQNDCGSTPLPLNRMKQMRWMVLVGHACRFLLESLSLPFCSFGGFRQSLFHNRAK